MNNLAIKIKGISKAYRIGLKEEKYDTIGAVLASWIKSPLYNFRRLRKLSKIHPDSIDQDVFWALKDIDLNVGRGEVIGIIGRNGAGKSTLLKILSRVTHPTTGEIDLYGRVASLLEVGTGFNPELTGRENVFLNGTILGMTKREVEDKYEEIVEFSGIRKFIDTPIKRYSSGMKVRLAFAVAAHLDPEILIIDEVLAVGDAEFQKKCLGKMQDVASEGRTILFVSHDLAAVQKLCPKSCLLENGRVVLFDSTNKVIDKYLNYSVLDSFESGFSFDGVKRKGSGFLRFERIYLEDSKGNKISSGQTGSDLKIVMDYTLKGNFFPNPVFQLRFNNLTGQNLFVCLTRNSYEGVIKLSNKGKAICVLPRLPLLPGKYYIDIWCKFDQAIADEIERAFILEVETGDYFGTGRLNSQMKNGLLVNNKWEFC